MLLFPDRFKPNVLLERFNPRKDTVVWKQFRKELKSFFLQHMNVSNSSIFDVYSESPFPFELPPMMGADYLGTVEGMIFDTDDTTDSDEHSDQVMAARLRFCRPAFIWAYNGLRNEILQLSKAIEQCYGDIDELMEDMGDLRLPNSENQQAETVRKGVETLSLKASSGTAYKFRKEQDLSDGHQIIDMEISSDEDRSHPTGERSHSSKQSHQAPVSFDNLCQEFNQLRHMIAEKRRDDADRDDAYSSDSYDEATNGDEDLIFGRNVTRLSRHITSNSVYNQRLIIFSRTNQTKGD